MFDLKVFTTNIRNFKNKSEFEKYLESCFMELEEYFEKLSLEEIDKLKFDFEDLLYDLEDQKLILQTNSKMINAFLILLAQKFEQAQLVGAITIILTYLPQCGVKKRLEASILYLKVNDISKDYFRNFEKILHLITDSSNDDEANYKAINFLANFYISGFTQFKRVNNQKLCNTFKTMFLENRSKYPLLKNDILDEIIGLLTFSNFDNTISTAKQLISSNRPSITMCSLENFKVTKEISRYSEQLQSLNHPTFEQIRQVSNDYISSIGNPDELYNQLSRGTKIIDDVNLLYKYMQLFGTKHKVKLASAFELIIDTLVDKKFHIIDWGCGQALATMVLLDFAKKRDVVLDIDTIILIEPSQLALCRGLLHVDIVKQKEYTIKAIESDLDCLDIDTIKFDDNLPVVHLFSNILDVESFKLNNNFFQKVAQTITSSGLFVCVSPNINDKRNARLDLFYNYFDENFDTSLISGRDTDIDGHTRYEKVFEVIREVTTTSAQSKEELKEYHLDIYEKLQAYKEFIYPILDPDRIKSNIETDPDYVVFKIRKVAESITSQIYSNYESDTKRVSFSDKIRYLSFTKNLFNKKIQSHLHTIRTIGNIGVHEDGGEVIKLLKEDAYFLVTALVLLLEDLKSNKFI